MDLSLKLPSQLLKPHFIIVPPPGPHVLIQARIVIQTKSNYVLRWLNSHWLLTVPYINIIRDNSIDAQWPGTIVLQIMLPHPEESMT